MFGSGGKRLKRCVPVHTLFRSMSLLITCSQIGLSLNKQKVPLLCILEPFLAGNQLLVTPYA